MGRGSSSVSPTIRLATCCFGGCIASMPKNTCRGGSSLSSVPTSSPSSSLARRVWRPAAAPRFLLSDFLKGESSLNETTVGLDVTYS